MSSSPPHCRPAEPQRGLRRLARWPALLGGARWRGCGASRSTTRSMTCCVARHLSQGLGYRFNAGRAGGRRGHAAGLRATCSRRSRPGGRSLRLIAAQVARRGGGSCSPALRAGSARDARPSDAVRRALSARAWRCTAPIAAWAVSGMETGRRDGAGGGGALGGGKGFADGWRRCWSAGVASGARALVRAASAGLRFAEARAGRAARLPLASRARWGQCARGAAASRCFRSRGAAVCLRQAFGSGARRELRRCTPWCRRAAAACCRAAGAARGAPVARAIALAAALALFAGAGVGRRRLDEPVSAGGAGAAELRAGRGGAVARGGGWAAGPAASARRSLRRRPICRSVSCRQART